MHYFFYLLLFFVLGLAILYFINWSKTGKPDKNWQYYAASVILGGVMAYFIDEKVFRALLMILAGIAVAWIISGITSISKTK